MATVTETIKNLIVPETVKNISEKASDIVKAAKDKATTYTPGATVTDAKSALDAHIANKPGPYTPGATVTDAKSALDAHIANKPGPYTSLYTDKIGGVLEKIEGRSPFSYDINDDALYQQYKDKYIQMGKLAMGDAMGQAAAMTGGYGNSWAQSVGQQAYQAQLENLNDIVPELYQMALDKYKMEGQDLYDQYALYSDMDDRDYGRYRDTVTDWTNDRGYLQGVYDSERALDYGQYRDTVGDWQNERGYLQGVYDSERAFDFDKWVDDRNFKYGSWRDSIADERYEESKNNGDEVVDEEDDEDDEDGGDDTIDADTSEYYADWDYGDWEGYFATIRNTEGKSAAEEELARMSSAGLIPKEFIMAAGIGARGSFGH